MTDVTELKRVQGELRRHKEELEELVTERTAELIAVNEQLREARDNLEALFAAAPLAIGVFDAEGNVTNINPAAERLYGWSREEFEGRLLLYHSRGCSRGVPDHYSTAAPGRIFHRRRNQTAAPRRPPLDVSFSAAPLRRSRRAGPGLHLPGRRRHPAQGGRRGPAHPGHGAGKHG